MTPTLKQGQNVLVNKLSYLFSKPKIKDIVAVKDPRNQKILIKRVSKISKNKLYVRGDNKKASTDSRSFGWVSKNAIIGKVIYISK